MLLYNFLFILPCIVDSHRPLRSASRWYEKTSTGGRRFSPLRVGGVVRRSISNIFVSHLRSTFAHLFSSASNVHPNADFVYTRTHIYVRTQRHA